jgi:hypothetical protein
LGIAVDSTKLTREHIAQILGPSISFNYKGGFEQRIYDEKVHYWVGDKYFESLYQLFHAMLMINMRANGSLDCFWIVAKSKVAAALNLLLIAIPRNARHDETKDKLHEKVFIQVPHDFDLNRNTNAFMSMINDIQINYSDIDLIIVSDATTSELKRMNDFKSTMQSSLSILIPQTGNAKLTAFNCHIDNHDLCNLFYGDGGESTQARVQEKGGIAVQIKVMGCTISFDEASVNGDSSNSGGGGGGGGGKSSHHSLGSESKNGVDMDQLIQHHHRIERQQQQQHPYIDYEYDVEDSFNSNNNNNYQGNNNIDVDEADQMKSPSFIHELPLGYRILNCCQQLIGKPKRKVLLIASGEKSDINKALFLTPGSAEYALAQNDKVVESDNDATRKTPGMQSRKDKLDIALKCINPSWTNIRSIKTTPSALNISYGGDDGGGDLSDINSFLPKQSMLSVSVHLGHEPLFAMAYKTLIVGLEGNIIHNIL